MVSPQWLRSCVGSCYRVLPSSLRYGSQYVKFKNSLKIKDPRKISSDVESKLADTLLWASQTVPAYSKYKALMEENIPIRQKLSRFPLTDKEVIKKNPTDYLSERMPKKSRLKMFTGGSLAQPMMFYLQKNVSRPKEKSFVGHLKNILGLSPEETSLLLRGRTVLTAKKKDGRLWMHDPIKKQLILSSDHLEEEYMDQYLEALLKYQPSYIEAFPSALYPLAKWLSAHPKAEITKNIRAVILSSENLYSYQEAFFKKVFNCPVINLYGHSERVLFATTLPDDPRFHFWPQYGYFELVDGEGNAITEPGVMGEIVGTSFDNRVMPFVRYRTNDYAYLSDGPPQSGFEGYPVCKNIEGRLQEFIVCKDDRLVSICTLGAAHFEDLLVIDEMQYEQKEKGKLVLKIVATTDLSDGAKRQITRAVEEKTLGGCEVELVRVDKIDRTAQGKHKMIIQHLDISQYLGNSLIV